MLRDFPLNCNDLFSGKKLITLGAALSVLPPVGRTTCAQLTARHTVAISQSSFKNDLFFIRFNKIIGECKRTQFFSPCYHKFVHYYVNYFVYTKNCKDVKKIKGLVPLQLKVFYFMIAFPIGVLVFSIFCLAAIVQLLYYLLYYARLAWFKPKSDFHTQPPISVVICAKNEALKLHKSIPLFFQQEYPQYQIVVVNDCSVDESTDILEEFQKKYANLHVVELNEDDIKAHDKKLALTLGIKGAKYEHLLLTDADCVPGDNQWIACMARNFSNDKEVVIGYGPYKKTSGFLNKLIRFDAFFIGLQYLSFSLAGKTYMGVGRNLAYTKTLFFRHKGFASQYHIQSGDDDLFINKVATKQNTIIELHPSSFSYSDPKTSLGAWIKQKRRHLTTAKHYKSSHKMILGLGSLTQYLFFISFAALLFSSFEPTIVLAIFGLKVVTQIVVLRKSMILMKESDLLFFAIFFEILLLVFYPIIYIGNAFVKKHKWK